MILTFRIVPIISIILLLIVQTQEQTDKGKQRYNKLLQRSLANNNTRVIQFSAEDYQEYVMIYPRPYDIVIYFHAQQIPLSKKLFPDFQYMVKLYEKDGIIDSPSYPVFFVKMTFNKNHKKMVDIFRNFQFSGAPNIIVSKPHMAIVSSTEFTSYMKQYIWKISHTDNEVQTSKILQFVNKRTKKDVVYRPTDQMIKQVMQYFLGASFCAVILYKFFKFIWNHWIFWFLMSIIIYISCMSGAIYCIINDIFGQKPHIQNGKMLFFSSGGSRSQGFYQGILASVCISLVGLSIIIILVTGQSLKQRYSVWFGIFGIFVLYTLYDYIQTVYGKKGWYGPQFYPPSHYLKGPLSVDQGNNI